MNKDVEKNVKSCLGCVMTVKAPPIKLNPWPKIGRSWSRLHIDFADLLKEQYYLIVVNSFSKWLEVIKCKNPICSKYYNKIFKNIFESSFDGFMLNITWKSSSQIGFVFIFF